MMTTRSAPVVSLSVKSRPAASGTPRAAKKPGETDRNFARGSSSPFSRTRPSTENENAGPELRASRQGTLLASATWSTPGSSVTRRRTSR